MIDGPAILAQQIRPPAQALGQQIIIESVLGAGGTTGSIRAMPFAPLQWGRISA
jgi:hypothetical protein